MNRFIIKKIDLVPTKEEVSAVFGIILNNSGQLLVTRNERGWDIPGGHLEKDEKPKDALIREVMEETFTSIKDVKLRIEASFAQRENPKKMLFYTANVDKVYPFQKRDDVIDRSYLLPEELMKIYGGGEPELMFTLLKQIDLV